MEDGRCKNYFLSSNSAFIFLHLVTSIFTSSSQSAYILLYCFSSISVNTFVVLRLFCDTFVVKTFDRSSFRIQGSLFRVHDYLPFTLLFIVFTIEVRILRILSISCFKHESLTKIASGENYAFHILLFLVL